MKTKTKMPKAMYGKTMMKKGGIKKMQDGGTLPKKPKPFSTKSSKIGLGILSSAIAGITGKVIGDAVKARKAKKAEEEKLKKEKETQSKSTEMKRGGAIKKMQKGGVIKKTLRKAQAGGPSDTAPSLKSTGVKNVYQGPINERDVKILDKNFPSTSIGPYAPAEYVTGNKKYSPRAVESYRRAREENMLRSNSPETQYWNKASGAGADNYGFSSSAMADAEEGTYKRGGRVKKTLMKKGGAVKKKMMTGGMVNPNAKVSKQTVAGSKGVTSGVNPKASASNVASSKGSGKANTPPSQATPAAKRGGAVKKMQRGGTPGYPGIPSPTKKIESSPRYSKSVYDSQGRIKPQKQMSKKMQKGGMIKRK